MNLDELAAVEADSIRRFVEHAVGERWLSGRVLDFGCGKQPYRALIEAAGCRYEGYDRKNLFGNVSGRDIGDLQGPYDAILCTQVLQYIEWPNVALERMTTMLRPGGHLVLTYPTVWPELRDELWRFTKIGVEQMIGGYATVVHHQRRAVITGTDLDLAVGYQFVARR